MWRRRETRKWRQEVGIRDERLRGRDDCVCRMRRGGGKEGISEGDALSGCGKGQVK